MDSSIGKEKYELKKDGRVFVVTFKESERQYYINKDGQVGEVVKREDINVGDYINYVPDINLENYPSSKLTAEITGVSGNNYDITQDKQYYRDGTGMTWQVFRIYADGSFDLIGSPTSQTIHLGGANGYNNGVTLLNDICKTLYSRGDIEARNINGEDVEYWLTTAGKKERDDFISSGGIKYGHTSTYLTNRYYPNLYLQEKGGNIDSGLANLTEGVDKENVKETGLNISDSGIASGYTQAKTSLTIKQTVRNVSLNSVNFGEGYEVLKGDNQYWCASRCTVGGLKQAVYGLLYVNNTLFTGEGLFISTTSVGGGNKSLRPIVALKSNVKIETCDGENNVNNMHKIQY